MIPHMRGAGVEPKPIPAFEINSPATPYRVAGDIFVFGVCKHVHEHVHDKKQVGADGASTCGFCLERRTGLEPVIITLFCKNFCA